MKTLKEYIGENELDTYIQADGGVNLETVELVKEAGAEILVVGSALISSGDYKQVINKIK